MKEVLNQTEKVCYFSFLMSLAKHEAINQTVGTLKVHRVLLTSRSDNNQFNCLAIIHVVK